MKLAPEKCNLFVQLWQWVGWRKSIGYESSFGNILNPIAIVLWESIQVEWDIGYTWLNWFSKSQQETHNSPFEKCFSSFKSQIQLP